MRSQLVRSNRIRFTITIYVAYVPSSFVIVINRSSKVNTIVYSQAQSDTIKWYQLKLWNFRLLSCNTIFLLCKIWTTLIFFSPNSVLKTIFSNVATSVRGTSAAERTTLPTWRGVSTPKTFECSESNSRPDRSKVRHLTRTIRRRRAKRRQTKKTFRMKNAKKRENPKTKHRSTKSLWRESTSRQPLKSSTSDFGIVVGAKSHAIHPVIWTW